MTLASAGTFLFIVALAVGILLTGYAFRIPHHRSTQWGRHENIRNRRGCFPIIHRWRKRRSEDQ